MQHHAKGLGLTDLKREGEDVAHHKQQAPMSLGTQHGPVQESLQGAGHDCSQRTALHRRGSSCTNIACRLYSYVYSLGSQLAAFVKPAEQHCPKGTAHCRQGSSCTRSCHAAHGLHSQHASKVSRKAASMQTGLELSFLLQVYSTLQLQQQLHTDIRCVCRVQGLTRMLGMD